MHAFISTWITNQTLNILQVLQAVDFMHNKGVVHRDLKVGNRRVYTVYIT